MWPMLRDHHVTWGTTPAFNAGSKDTLLTIVLRDNNATTTTRISLTLMKTTRNTITTMPHNSQSTQ